MAYDKNNIFAHILAGKIPCDKIAENDNAFAFYDINPQAVQHALVVPKGEYVSLVDFCAKASAQEMADWLKLIGEVAATLGVDKTGYRLLINNGADARQEVPHLHAHIAGGEDLGHMLRVDKK